MYALIEKGCHKHAPKNIIEKELPVLWYFCTLTREILNTCMYFNLKKKLEKKIEKEDPCGLYFLFYRVRILIFEYDINLFL